MRQATRIPLRLALRSTPLIRPIHTTISKPANVAPILGTGPPPEAPPAPATVPGYQRVERRKRQAEMLKHAKQIRIDNDGKKHVLKKRFWTHVQIRKVDEYLHIFLDERPLRHPTTKQIVQVPLTKPHLATALALEWDHLTSAQEATKHHLIPLTSLVCRALDIDSNDNNPDIPEADKIRASIMTTVLRYLDTDTVLCWAPPAGPYDIKNDAGESLRDVQKKTAEEIVSFLTTNVWPGIKIEPVLDGHSIFPKKQSEGVREVVQGWVAGLDAWEITALERAVLAGKSFIAAARLVAEWSEGSVNATELGAAGHYGVEEAARATNLEVDWQATQWGEVEDTHDVNFEDVRRQLGSAVLLVSGTRKA